MNKVQKIPARYVALLIQYLEEQGTDCSQALAQAGIARERLRHIDAQLPSDQIILATRLLTEASHGQRDLGMRIGAKVGPGQLGELGLAMLACATVKDSLDLCARYHLLVTPAFSMRTRMVGSLYEVCWQPIQPVPYDVMVLAYDLMLMSCHTWAQNLLRDDMPSYDAYFFSAAPADLSRYGALKGVRCHFGQGGLPALRILMDAEVLSRTFMPMADANHLAEIERRLDMKLLHHLQQTQRDWKAWITMMLTEAQGHQPTLDELAKIVNLSASTLARYLAAQGASFRDLAQEIQHERACQWLREGHLQVRDVASLLGYTNPANFIRAFKARAGMSPARYAKAQAGEPSGPRP
ncbi:MAG: AraC family transcriptional regulator [Rubrivivax sp.]|nr:MAG: AraC family transcriptional regulator [Rubrivivax sp.]